MQKNIILIYIFSKVHPKRMDSDIKYMELFNLDKDGLIDNILTVFNSVCTCLENFEYKKLI